MDLAQDECVLEIVEEVLDAGLGSFGGVLGQGIMTGLREGLSWRVGGSAEGLGHVQNRRNQ